jgi:hypothetical protein
MDGTVSPGRNKKGETGDYRNKLPGTPRLLPGDSDPGGLLKKKISIIFI